jgi:redox-sensing transcriptional repressor
MAGHVSDAVIRRLPGYYRHLRELEAAGVTSISSQELGDRMNLTPSQIRQDINCFGGFGRQGYGYRVSELKDHIGEILGLDREHRLIILGAGNIGCAVAQYPTFSREGFRTIALFDTLETKVGRCLGEIPVLHMDRLEEFVSENVVDIAVLALPKRNAQEALTRLYQVGVRAIWNFAPTDLNHPEDMLVVNVHLSDSLQQLSYRMAHRND